MNSFILIGKYIQVDTFPEKNNATFKKRDTRKRSGINFLFKELQFSMYLKNSFTQLFFSPDPS